MFKAFDACAPHQVHHRPHGPDWLHEIKYDSYRLRLERDGDCVRLISRDGGPDRYPWIVQAARMVRLKRFVLDGEAVLDEISASAFNALQSRNHEPSSAPSTSWSKATTICAGRRCTCVIGSALGGAIVSGTRFERGEIRPELVRTAYEFGLEGLVSKHREEPEASRFRSRAGSSQALVRLGTVSGTGRPR